ncbi:hypothetical protein [Myroides profundi]|uniref:Adenylosuccinate lyase n=1 Tax=Myroides profundi TaxID=480520 RepID=A0AAJ4W6E7_MYRPR|nr:hypothetical protein [Myroides profundi]AJH15637.1 hypothetical protein MPR_2471 [Myroides profundi]SER47882.1 hypothetical protein SAMN04488089_11714 [Myroides profundi]
MTHKEFYQIVLETDIHVKSRVDTLAVIGSDEEVLKFLLKYSFEYDDAIHVMSTVLLQDILDKDILRLEPYLDTFIDNAEFITNESSKRLISRICWLIAKSKKLVCTSVQEKKLVDVSLLWLSNDSKVASEAFAMDILMLLGQQYKEDLKLISEVIELNYPHRTVAYQNKAKKFMSFRNALE